MPLIPRQSLISPTSLLSGWDFMVDSCGTTGGQFLGILCSNPLDNVSSRIIAIDLDGVEYDGFLTPSIGNLSELTIFNLGKNKFRRIIPETIANLKKLTMLSLADNYFTGTIPNEITLLKNLECLDIFGNKIYGSVPVNISGLRSLSGNALTGTIPNLTALWQLKTLDLSAYQFYGYLPNLPFRLTTLSLNHNKLSSHISSVKKLKNLVRLDVSDNRFSGLISDDILSLPRLVYLNVSNNRFNGIETFKISGEETQLQVLDAENNQFPGHLPTKLVTIQNLTQINFAHNQFSSLIKGIWRKTGAIVENPLHG